jgi:hypothetical protein
MVFFLILLLFLQTVRRTSQGSRLAVVCGDFNRYLQSYYGILLKILLSPATDLTPTIPATSTSPLLLPTIPATANNPD